MSGMLDMVLLRDVGDVVERDFSFLLQFEQSRLSLLEVADF